MKTIGVITGNITSKHAMGLLQGISERSREKGVQINAFLGVHTSDYYQVIFGRSADRENFDYQCNVVYSYSSLSRLDALIISCGTVGIFLEKRNLNEFLEMPRQRGLPTVLVEAREGPEGMSTLICDNRGAAYKIAKHMIEVCGCRNIVTVAGPAGNEDAEERLRGLRQAMEEHGLTLEESRIERGDYSAACGEQAEQLLLRYPEADCVIAGNDMMAKTVYDICRKHGKEPGRDIMVAGFDDDPNVATAITPGLTTVKQDAFSMGRKAVDLALDLMAGGAPRHAEEPAIPVFRGSSGAKETLDADYFRAQLVEKTDEARLFQQTAWFLPQISRMMLESVHDESRFYQIMLDKLNQLGCQNIWLALLDKPIRHGYGENWVCPDSLNLAAALEDGQARVYSPESFPQITAEHTIDKLGAASPLFKSVLPVFSGAFQVGLLITDAPIGKMPLLYLALQQIVTAMDFYRLNQELAQKNAVLEVVSARDPMTGTLNRRGLMEFIVTRMNKSKMRVFFADLDHLKEINDTFGHAEGDNAICQVAEALKRTFSDENMAISRIGGDELTVISFFADRYDPRKQIADMKQRLAGYNTASGKPYYVEASIGFFDFPVHAKPPLTEILSKADALLYDAKKSRRRSACRETV